MREILNAIFYVQRSGCQWEMLPHDLPPYTTVYGYFRKWQRQGIWAALPDQLRQQLRQKLGREPECRSPISGYPFLNVGLGGFSECDGWDSQDFAQTRPYAVVIPSTLGLGVNRKFTMTTLAIALQPTLELTDEQFEEICRHNRDLRLERSARGELIIMPPTGGETGRRNLKLGTRLCLWNEQSGLGEAFDSSTGFKLPNGAIRAPDAAWVRRDR